MRSPPPLQHPIPTHPRVPVPEPATFEPEVAYAPPPAPAAAPAGRPGDYQRICSPSFPNTSDPYAYASQGQTDSQRYAPQAQAQQWFGGSDPYMPQGYPSIDASMQAARSSEPTWGMETPFDSTMMNDATTQMGMQFGRHVAQVGGEYVQRNLRAVLPMPVLKHYFNVSNSYVLHKLRILLFPWQHRPWSRRLRVTTPYGSGATTPVGSSTPTPYAAMGIPERPLSAADMKTYGAHEAVSYCPPREDVNSPDMYIPLMAFVTYVIITSFIYGLRGRFHPEILGYTASRALAIVLIELAAVKLGCYLLNIQGDHTLVDLLAYSGYKFVGTLVVLAVGLLGLGSWLYWLTFLYAFAATAFFLLRSLRYVVLPDPSLSSSTSVTHADRSIRIQFLFGIAVSQLVFGWLLVVGVFR